MGNTYISDSNETATNSDDLITKHRYALIYFM